LSWICTAVDTGGFYCGKLSEEEILQEYHSKFVNWFLVLSVPCISAIYQFERSHPVVYWFYYIYIYIYIFTTAGSETYTGTEARSLLHEEAGNHLTKKLTREDATNPKQKAVTDYKEQVDRAPQSTRKLKSRTNTTTMDITTRSPISE